MCSLQRSCIMSMFYYSDLPVHIFVLKTDAHVITCPARLPVVILTLYNLHLSSGGKLGYFRGKDHICPFIEKHWEEFFGPER